MKKYEKSFFTFILIILCFVFVPRESSAKTEYRELHRTSIKMNLGKSKLLPSEKQRIYNFFVEVKNRLRGRPLDSELVVIGYANNIGGKSYDNQRLADIRANVVKEFIEYTYSGNPEKKIPGLKVDHAFGKVQDKEYSGVINKFGSTGVLVIMNQNVENFPFDNDDIYHTQIEGFNHLDENDLVLSSKLDRLGQMVSENNQIIKNDNKIATAMHAANKAFQNKQFVFWAIVGIVVAGLLIVVIWPNSSEGGYSVVVDNSKVSEGVKKVGARTETAINMISATSDSVERKVGEVATSVKKIEEGLTGLKIQDKSTKQKQANVPDLTYGGKKYTAHLENDGEGKLTSPFRRPKKGMKGEFIKFHTMNGGKGARKQIRRIFERAQNVNDKLHEHWKGEVEHLINNPLFEGPRLIQQERDK